MGVDVLVGVGVGVKVLVGKDVRVERGVQVGQCVSVGVGVSAGCVGMAVAAPEGRGVGDTAAASMATGAGAGSAALGPVSTMTAPRPSTQISASAITARMIICFLDILHLPDTVNTSVRSALILTRNAQNVKRDGGFYSTNNGTIWNLSTSTSPLSVILSEGMTGSARNDIAINGSCRFEPSWCAARSRSCIWSRTVSIG